MASEQFYKLYSCIMLDKNRDKILEPLQEPSQTIEVASIVTKFSIKKQGMLGISRTTYYRRKNNLNAQFKGLMDRKNIRRNRQGLKTKCIQKSENPCDPF